MREKVFKLARLCEIRPITTESFLDSYKSLTEGDCLLIGMPYKDYMGWVPLIYWSINKETIYPSVRFIENTIKPKPDIHPSYELVIFRKNKFINAIETDGDKFVEFSALMPKADWSENEHF